MRPKRWWIAFLLALAGCPKREPAPPPTPPAPRLVEVRVVERGGGGDPALDVAALAARATEDLRAAQLMPITVDAGARSGVDYRCRVEVELAWSDADLRAMITARLARVDAPPDEPPIVSRGAAARPIEARTDRALALHTHVERLTDDVLRGLAAQARLHLGGAAELTAALAGSDGDLVEEATRVAAQRKERAAVPALTDLLKRDDEAVRDRALGALIEIGDRRAVKPITELTRFHDVEQMPKIIDAVAALGGDDAKAYLEFVATGHDDPEVRALAKEALARLARRAAAPAPTEKSAAVPSVT